MNLRVTVSSIWDTSVRKTKLPACVELTSLFPESTPSYPTQNCIKRPSLSRSFCASHPLNRFAVCLTSERNHKPLDENFSLSNLQKQLHLTLFSSFCAAVREKGPCGRSSSTLPRDWCPHFPHHNSCYTMC